MFQPTATSAGPGDGSGNDQSGQSGQPGPSSFSSIRPRPRPRRHNLRAPSSSSASPSPSLRAVSPALSPLPPSMQQLSLPPLSSPPSSAAFSAPSAPSVAETSRDIERLAGDLSRQHLAQRGFEGRVSPFPHRRLPHPLNPLLPGRLDALRRQIEHQQQPARARTQAVPHGPLDQAEPGGDRGPVGLSPADAGSPLQLPSPSSSQRRSRTSWTSNQRPSDYLEPLEPAAPPDLSTNASLSTGPALEVDSTYSAPSPPSSLLPLPPPGSPAEAARAKRAVRAMRLARVALSAALDTTAQQDLGERLMALVAQERAAAFVPVAAAASAADDDDMVVDETAAATVGTFDPRHLGPDGEAWLAGLPTRQQSDSNTVSVNLAAAPLLAPAGTLLGHSHPGGVRKSSSTSALTSVSADGQRYRMSFDAAMRCPNVVQNRPRMRRRKKYAAMAAAAALEKHQHEQPQQREKERQQQEREQQRRQQERQQEAESMPLDAS